MRKKTQLLERYFTVVNWDQRRAAKSFAAGRDHARMTMGQFADDIIVLSSYLAKRFGKKTILLAGPRNGGRDERVAEDHILLVPEYVIDVVLASRARTELRHVGGNAATAVQGRVQ